MADHAAATTAAGGAPWWAVRHDALNRAWRTLYTGFILDALVLIGAGLANLLTEHEVTSGAFWITLGILILKSFLTSLGSYLLRLKVTPKTTPKEGQPG
jgi:heme A synthase